MQRRTATQMNAEDPGLCAEYYRELYDIVRPESRKEALREAIERQDFVDVAKRYRLIEQDAVNVLVPYDPVSFPTIGRGGARHWSESVVDCRSPAVHNKLVPT